MQTAIVERLERRSYTHEASDLAHMREDVNSACLRCAKEQWQSPYTFPYKQGIFE